MTDATAPSRAGLRAHLVRTMIAGEVATPRQNNLLHFRRMAAGMPYYQFGLDLKPTWTERSVLEMMVERCGVDPDPMHLYGDDTIDPDLTIDALEAMGDRIGLAARRRETVVLATGHPATLSPLYQAVAGALAARGCRVLTPSDGWTYEVDGSHTEAGVRRLVYAPGGVAMLVDSAGRTQHTHDPHPMEAMLAELGRTVAEHDREADLDRTAHDLDRTVAARDGTERDGTGAVRGRREAEGGRSEAGPGTGAAKRSDTVPAALKASERDDWPDLAIADHGWAGAAGQAGIDTVGFADCNDPALFAGAAEGKIDVVVPLDDGISPQHYAPLTAYLLARAGLG